MQLQEIVLRYTKVFQDIMEAAAELDWYELPFLNL